MPRSNEGLQQQLGQLRESFRARLPGRVEEIAGVWNAIARDGWNAENGKRFHRLVHSLAGAAATFGFDAVSQSARQLELSVEPFIAAGKPLPTEQSDSIPDLLRVLQAPVLGDDWDEASSQAELAKPSRLVLVTPGSGMRELAAQIGYFGYEVGVVCGFSSLTCELNQRKPAAILIDADVFSNENPLDAFAATQSSRHGPIPIIYISSYGDLGARLASVRAGADSYFTKPVNITRLIDKLDRFTAYHAPAPYRILVVEDDEAMAQYCATTLRQAGMETCTVSDPTQVMPQLIDWKPDLILMDLYMPNCSGLELAAVIRQEEAYVSIPIVYLSAETRLEKQLAAMKLGGDDFLTKPIQPEHLISSVTARAERSHALRALILHDSLTGLLNHTAIKGHLETEIARAKRKQAPLAYAMLDIDCFKRVNDNYGHPTGDSVLKTLARLLQQRLRKTDVIGRYGGEEFAVILPEAGARQAGDVLDEIRSTFSQIRQQAGSEEFAVTFSAGVAAFPEFGEAKLVNDASDRALYLAKRNGRNQVRLAHKSMRT